MCPAGIFFDAFGEKTNSLVIFLMCGRKATQLHLEFVILDFWFVCNLEFVFCNFINSSLLRLFASSLLLFNEGAGCVDKNPQPQPFFLEIPIK